MTTTSESKKSHLENLTTLTKSAHEFQQAKADYARRMNQLARHFSTERVNNLSGFPLFHKIGTPPIMRGA